MSPPPDASQEHYRTLQRLQAFMVAVGRRAWARMTPEFDASWRQVAPALVAVTSTVQLRAAEAAVAYVPAVLAETNQADRPDARVRPQRFAGVAADGRSLAGLLSGAVVRSKAASGGGLAPSLALAYGGRWLDMALQTAVTDAARQATSLEVMTRNNMGWVRMVNPPCCARCAVLAGKWYRFSEGFQRHPRCDCIHIPAAENVAGSFTTSPRALVERGLVRDLTARQREAIDGGADITRVLNEGRDRWREQMAVLRDQARRDAARRVSPEDFMSDLTTRVQALGAARTAGFIAD